jgi:hypothetical protein
LQLFIGFLPESVELSRLYGRSVLAILHAPWRQEEIVRLEAMACESFHAERQQQTHGGQFGEQGLASVLSHASLAVSVQVRLHLT